jgi:hypothetical protein
VQVSRELLTESILLRVDGTEYFLSDGFFWSKEPGRLVAYLETGKIAWFCEGLHRVEGRGIWSAIIGN